MKKISYFIGATFIALLTGCSDIEPIEPGPQYPVDENEVPFGAGEGAFSTDEKSDKSNVVTRTIYEIEPGKKFETYDKLIVSWMKDDPIRVYSPEAPEGYRTADYKVNPETDAGEGDYGKGGFLMKVGANGIHWGSGPTQRFFAFYPGSDKFLPYENNLKTSGKFTHTIPVAQLKGKEISYDSATGQVVDSLRGNWKIISPDMTFCNMVAETTCVPNGKEEKINLNFYPLVTVLDVVITGGDITYNILGVSVTSKTQDIVGTYTFDFEAEKGKRITFDETSGNGNKIAYISCMHGQTPLTLKPGENLNLKFFLLPRDIDASELTISVLCENGYVLRKSLDIGKQITLKAGRVIKIRTPKLKLGKTSNWMSMIDDNVYFASQLSLPGAKHAYSYTTLDDDGKVYSDGGQTGISTNKENPVIDRDFKTQTTMMPFYQTLNIKDLFNSGIRAFDIKVITDDGTAKIFTAGRATQTTLVDFLNELKSLIGGDTETATEGAVVNINFAYSKDASQDNWVQKIKDALVQYDPDGSTLCKVTSETTMKEMRGHIGIMLHYNGNQTYNTKYIGIVKGFDTSVQNTKNTVLQLGGTGRLHLQNLYQVNNPEITNPKEPEKKIDGVRDGVGLCPHFILHENVINGTPIDLIQKKKELLNQLLEESHNGDGALEDLYLNDLSGFCVVNDNSSTGWRNYTEYTWNAHDILWDRWTDKEFKNLRDPIQFKNMSQEEPKNPKDGDKYFTITGGAPEKGNGGNTALFAQEINDYAQTQIYHIVDKGRAPLGIVYMNFAGVRTVTVKGKQYQVKGINLPSMIMTHNFKFALRKKTSTPTP